MSITRLPDSTQERLRSMSIPSAAGLVKELLDNSIDAQATSVEVLISQNAIDKIEVRDNGIGIHPNDFDYLGRPGCTSKLRCFEDLEKASATTLGFRGEALSTVKSLAVVSIITKRPEDTVGTSLEIDQVNGGIISQKAISAPTGTTVSATKLFANLKVRAECAVKESQKTIAHIRELLISYAMARPSLRLTLKVMGCPKSGWSYSPGHQPSIKEVLLQVMGPELALSCVERVTAAVPEKDLSSNYALEAYIVSPKSTFAKLPKSRYISVDGRPVAAGKGTMKKLVAIYKKHLRKVIDSTPVTIGNPGECFMRLNITCPIGSYDANVEPAKDNVIFTNETHILEQFEALCADTYRDTPTQSASASEVMAAKVKPSDNGQRTENSGPALQSPVVALERTPDCPQPTRFRVNMSDDFNQTAQEFPVRKRLPIYRRPVTSSPALPMPQQLEENLPIHRPNQTNLRDPGGPIPQSFSRPNSSQDGHEELRILQPKDRCDFQAEATRPFVQPNYSVRRQDGFSLPQLDERAPLDHPSPMFESFAGSGSGGMFQTQLISPAPTNPNNSMPMVNQRKRRPQPTWSPPSLIDHAAGEQFKQAPPDGLTQGIISFGHCNEPLIKQKAFKPVMPNITACPSVEPQTSICNEETLTETTLETGDPRAYLLRRQKSIAIRPHKFRRLKSCLMPLEAIPAENQLHDLCYTTNIALQALRPYMKQVESFDRYVAEGENVEGLDLNLAKGRIIEAKLQQLVPDRNMKINLVGILKGKAPSA